MPNCHLPRATGSMNRILLPEVVDTNLATPCRTRGPMMSLMAIRGALEQAVMELLWARDVPRTVAEVLEEMNKDRDLAYTTVMTVLDRLAKKNMVTRDRVDRAWQYLPADPQDVVAARDLAEALDGVPGNVRIEALRRFFAALPAEERDALGTMTDRVRP
ncbi:BlaI/MecI/CopY family transcriptional regulator [Tessaracoccus antarcticus]|uniref:BlaI/MecI/CopY family transcriptional regulator n=2 Tax=Tessaracoccus antarcticus TaxID=2479848 RepID=A0A3M0GII7_9ACTN|nr:BlaI/MecI/CopY family transcriptional regulator [Tessaracoccus antarcticus]